MSVRDCQSILKKAIVERLREKYRLFPLPEDGETVAVSFQIHADRVRLSLDASGTALNRRGYRTWNGEAPLRETLAAALVELSPWRPGIPSLIPCAGRGLSLLRLQCAWPTERRVSRGSLPWKAGRKCLRPPLPP